MTNQSKKTAVFVPKEPPSHSPEYLTLIKTLIQTNPLSHRTVSLPLSPPHITEAVTLHTNVLMDQVLWKAQIIQAAVLHISTTAFPRHTFPLKRKHTCDSVCAFANHNQRSAPCCPSVTLKQNWATDEIFLPCCGVLLLLLTSEELLGNFGKL